VTERGKRHIDAGKGRERGSERRKDARFETLTPLLCILYCTQAHMESKPGEQGVRKSNEVQPPTERREETFREKDQRMGFLTRP
jgi:hypothetical protein